MSVQKTPNGRFRAKLKSGRVDVASRVFDTQREAKAWLARERAALAGGVDPRAGRQRVRLLVVEWLEVRRTTVAAKTYRADQDLLRLMPTSMLALHVSAVSGREVARSFEALLAAGLAESSVRRYRASLSSFFAWCVREKLVLANPVIGVTVPKQSGEVEEMDPFSEGHSKRSMPSGARSPHAWRTCCSYWRGRDCAGPKRGRCGSRTSCGFPHPASSSAVPSPRASR